MKLEDFKTEIEEAINSYASDYAESIGYKITDEKPGWLQAELTLEDYTGREWGINIIERDNKVVIDIDGDNFLPFSPEGFYCYLWCQACRIIHGEWEGE